MGWFLLKPRLAQCSPVVGDSPGYTSLFSASPAIAERAFQATPGTYSDFLASDSMNYCKRAMRTRCLRFPSLWPQSPECQQSHTHVDLWVPGSTNTLSTGNAVKLFFIRLSLAIVLHLHGPAI